MDGCQKCERSGIALATYGHAEGCREGRAKPTARSIEQRYNTLLERSATRRIALIAAKDKLRFYRAAQDRLGIHVEGADYNVVMKVIDDAIG